MKVVVSRHIETNQLRIADHPPGNPEDYEYVEEFHYFPGSARYVQDTEIHVGDIYESCSFHPVLCTNKDDDGIWGISLIDGSLGHGCDLNNCGVRKLTVSEAMAHKANWDRKDAPSDYWINLYDELGIPQPEKRS